MTIFRTNPPTSKIFAGAVVLLAGLAGCAPTTAPSAVAVGPVSPGAARIWFYRDYEPSVSLGLATVTLNGGVVGHAQPDGSAFYRDIAPGRYAVGVVNSAIGLGPGGTVELRPGEQAYVKITALDGWTGGGDRYSWSRDTFQPVIMPPQVGEAQLPGHPIASGG